MLRVTNVTRKEKVWLPLWSRGGARAPKRGGVAAPGLFDLVAGHLGVGHGVEGGAGSRAWAPGQVS